MESDDDALASLEERIHRTVELVSTLRTERDAAVADAHKLRQELEDLRSQRKQARVRIEKLLGQMDLIRGSSRRQLGRRSVGMDSGPERKTVRVTIYNQPYTLAVSGESGEVEALAHSVDQLMTDIAQQAGNVEGSRVAVLACLHLADRLRGLEQELSDFRSQVGEKNSPLLRACWTRRYGSILTSSLLSSLNREHAWIEHGFGTRDATIDQAAMASLKQIHSDISFTARTPGLRRRRRRAGHTDAGRRRLDSHCGLFSDSAGGSGHAQRSPRFTPGGEGPPRVSSPSTLARMRSEFGTDASEMFTPPSDPESAHAVTKSASKSRGSSECRKPDISI